MYLSPLFVSHTPLPFSFPHFCSAVVVGMTKLSDVSKCKRVQKCSVPCPLHTTSADLPHSEQPLHKGHVHFSAHELLFARQFFGQCLLTGLVVVGAEVVVGAVVVFGTVLKYVLIQDLGFGLELGFG